MARDSEFAVRAPGLAKLNRDLGKISNDIRKESVAHLREAAREVRDTARDIAPRLTGELAGSLRYNASNRGAAVTSALPQAPVLEYGGTIAPKGTPIRIERHRFVGQAVQRHASDIEDQLGSLLDRISRSNGFHL